MKKYIIIGASVLAATIVIVGGIFTYNALKPKELILKAPKEVSVVLKKSFKSSGAPVQKTFTETKNGITYHHYEKLAAGNYNYVTSSSSYYAVKTNLYFSKKKANTVTEIDVNPGKKTGNGFEADDTVNNFTEELQKSAFPEKESWKKDYPDVFTTPTLSSKTKGKNEFTSQKEMEEFVKSAVDSSDNLYEFNLLTSPVYKFKTPLVILTKCDLKDVTDLDKAAEILKKDGKPTVFYEAQIHGNEPAGGEGALAILKSLSGKYGDALTEKINVVLIPRVNVDGSKKFQRNNVANGFDMNRDHIKIQSKEIAAVHNAFSLFEPEMFIDGHEYNPGNSSEKDAAMRDVLIAIGGTYNSGKDYGKLSLDFSQNSINTLKKEGIRTAYYKSIAGVGMVSHELMVNSANFSSGRGFYSMTGAVSVLVETRGISLGRQNFVRRVLSQYITVKSLLDFAAKNSDKLKATVSAERDNIIKMGEKYDENTLFSLSTGSDKKKYTEITDTVYNYVTGKVVKKDAKVKCYYYDKAVRSRSRPTAYVLPKDDVSSELVLKIINKQSINYYELKPGESATLKQYTDSKSGVSLTEEKTVTFNGGAYVFPLNQISGNILMYLFEPDIDDTKKFNSSLAQSKTIMSVNGLFPIYRSEQDLTDGKIK